MTEGTITQPINKIVSLSRASVLPCLVLVCVLAIFPFSCSWASTPDSMNSSEFGPREMPQNSHAAFDDPTPSTALAKGQATFHPELIAPAAGEQLAEDGADNGADNGDNAGEDEAAPPPEPIDPTADAPSPAPEDPGDGDSQTDSQADPQSGSADNPDD